MKIVSSSKPVSKRDLGSIKTMIGKRIRRKQTKMRRISIWPALGIENAIDAFIITKRKNPNGTIRISSNIVQILLDDNSGQANV